MDVLGVAVTGVLTLAGVFLGHWLSAHRSEQEREAAARERWRELAFSVLGPLGTWLTDAHPDRLGINADREASSDVFAELRGRCNGMREQLATLAVGLPTDRGRDLAGRLEVAIFNSLVSSQWFVHDLLNHRDTTEPREKAKSEHDTAIETREALAEEVRSLALK
jgi:hypothetical protein